MQVCPASNIRGDSMVYCNKATSSNDGDGDDDGGDGGDDEDAGGGDGGGDGGSTPNSIIMKWLWARQE